MSACDEEPCKSLIGDYWETVFEASMAELVLRAHCEVLKTARGDYWKLLSIWGAVFAQAVACMALHLPPWLCAGLAGASLVLLVLLLVWFVRIMRFRAIVRVHERICRDLYSKMLSLRRQIAVRCPRECQPQAVAINCTC